MKEDQRQFEGPARVFDSQEEAIEAIWNGKVKDGDIVVVRYEGPRGGPGITEIYAVLGAINGMGLNAAVVTDGKFSGFTRGRGICQVTPEAAVGGPIAVVQEGDILTIAITERKLNIKLSENEIQKRLESWKPKPARVKNGILSIYAQLAEPASRGAMPRTLEYSS
jgi:dihydroxy-acid dehydratase